MALTVSSNDTRLAPEPSPVATIAAVAVASLAQSSRVPVTGEPRDEAARVGIAASRSIAHRDLERRHRELTSVACHHERPIGTECDRAGPSPLSMKNRAGGGIVGSDHGMGLIDARHEKVDIGQQRLDQRQRFAPRLDEIKRCRTTSRLRIAQQRDGRPSVHCEQGADSAEMQNPAPASGLLRFGCDPPAGGSASCVHDRTRAVGADRQDRGRRRTVGHPLHERDVDAFTHQRVQHPVRLLAGADGPNRERLQTETRARNDRSAGGARDRESNFFDQQAPPARTFAGQRGLVDNKC